MDNEEKELKGKIIQALSEQEEEYIPGAWENFVRKRNRRRRIVFVRYSSAVAASLFLGWLIIGTPGINNQKKRDLLSSKPSISVVDSSKPDNGIPDETLILSDDKSKAVAVKTFAEKFSVEKVAGKKVNDVKIKKKKIAPEKVTGDKGKADKDKADKDKAEIISVTEKPDQKTSLALNQETENSEKVIVISDTTTVTKEMAISESVQKKVITENDYNGIKPRPERKVKFGINVAPGMSATSTGSSFNYSGGVNLDIPITSNLQISTGVQVEHQSVVSKSTGYNSAIPADVNRAELVNLDIPINITWNVASNKSGSYYISGGISSIAFLSEKYTTTTYRQELKEFATTAAAGSEDNKTYRLEQVKTTNTRSVPGNEVQDIGGRLNLIIGFKRELTPGLSLHIEPFLKIPVTGMASEKLRFTTSGVTCKISF